MSTRVGGRIVDVLNRHTFNGYICFEKGVITAIEPNEEVPRQTIIPGLIDSHVHIESSMMLPTEFARAAVSHGTVATVSDPHEIANVLGIDGVRFMLHNAKRSPFKFFFTVPSCVPATSFETTGSKLDSVDIRTLLSEPEMVGLSEMMDIPGVLNAAPRVQEKLAVAKELQKPVDGHAPGLSKEEAEIYIRAGISTDHECISLEEGRHKISKGMKVQIREGSAAKNLDALMPLLGDQHEMCMFCSDDKHPDDLCEGHVNRMVRRCIAAGYDPLNVLWSASVTPRRHYGLRTGLLQPGDPADFVVLDALESFNVKETWIDGVCLAKDGRSLIGSVDETPKNCFRASPIALNDVQVKTTASQIPVIEVIDGQLVTKRYDWTVTPGMVCSDSKEDILKIIVQNRYEEAPPAIGFIKGFGIHGAIASSVAHDSHNIVAVGSNDEHLVQVVNGIIRVQGGIAVVSDGMEEILPLPVAGIMSPGDAYEIGERYHALSEMAKALGCPLQAPFMTLSFMCLLVIPDLKISDKGLFDGVKFELITIPK